MWRPVTTLSCGSKEGFTRACAVLAERLHVVNRRLVGCETLEQRTALSVSNASDLLIQQWRQTSASATTEQDTQQRKRPHMSRDETRDRHAAGDALGKASAQSPDETRPIEHVLASDTQQHVTVIIRRLISRMSKAFPHTLDAVVTSEDGTTLTVVPISAFSSFTPCYRLTWRGPQHADGTPTLLLSCWVHPSTSAPCDPFAPSDSHKTGQCEITDASATLNAEAMGPTVRWLKDRLLPKMVEWTMTEEEGPLAKWRQPAHERPFTLTEYADKYHELKAKYADRLVKNWPETTDPQKFVFEELGIAAYLCLLFNNTPSTAAFPYKFVDLGCGNGLLTYVLSCEGFQGVGVDLRRRRIWDWYSPQPELMEAAVNPQLGCTYPECEWLIGNHSDELTPWLPVMATLCSPHQHMWVLPCCPFELNATRHSQTHGTASQYDSYLLHILDLVERLGFRVATDVLRIPSTKRVCLVGTRLPHTSADRQQQMGLEAEESEPGFQRFRAVAEALVSEHRGVKPRPKEQVTRNCTRLPRAFLNECVQTVAYRLLHVAGVDCGVTMGCSDDGGPVPRAVERDNTGAFWRRGGELSLREVAQLLGRERLKRLKSECGGVKTLLKNHRQVFEVAGGKVRLRDWRCVDAKAPKAIKSRPCWFFLHHPDGCPRPAEQCTFKHGEHDTAERFAPPKEAQINREKGETN